MKKIIFLNREILKQDNFTDSILVPLNPVAMRDVLASGRDYLKIEKYFDYDFALRNKEKIWRAFQDFVDKSDEIAAGILGNPKLAKFGPFNLTIFILRQIIETEIIYYKIFSEIMMSVQSSEIHYLSQKDNDENDNMETGKFSSDIYKLVLNELAARNNIKFILIETRSANSSGKPDATTSFWRNQKKNIYHFLMGKKVIQYARLGLHEKNVRKIKARALFLQAGWRINYYSQFFTDSVFDSTEIRKCLNAYEPVRKTRARHCELLEGLQTEITHLSELFGFDVAFILKDNLERYTEVILSIAAKAFLAENYLKKHTFSFAFYTNLNMDMLPALLALYWGKEIVKVCKCHGDSLFDLTVWRNNDLKPANVYLTEFPEMAHYFQDNANAVRSGTVCEYDGVRLNGGAKKNVRPKKKLVYVPWLFDPGCSFDVNAIPLPLFFRIQLQILAVLSEQTEFEVVYKCLPRGAYDYHFPMPQYIADNFKNIKISYKPIKQELKKASACLTDAPSSSMWDAINMRVPCHSLVWSKSHLRKSAVEFYKNYLTFFDSDTDVGEKVQLILKEKKFGTIASEEAALLKRKSIEITDLFEKALKFSADSEKAG